MISSAGRVWHRYLGRFMNPGLETSGYLFIMLSCYGGTKIVQLNRLVLMAFDPIPNPELYQANHKNGIKINNHLYNLEWTTRSENQLHAYRTGLHKQPPNTILTEDQAREVVELLKTNKYQCKEIASMLNINENIVNSIKKKSSWKNLTIDCEFDHRIGTLYTDEEVHRLCRYYELYKKPEGMTNKDFVRQSLIACGFSPEESEYRIDTARKIYTKKYYTRISKDYSF